MPPKNQKGIILFILGMGFTAALLKLLLKVSLRHEEDMSGAVTQQGNIRTGRAFAVPRNF